MHFSIREVWIQNLTFQFSSVQSLSRVWLFATPWIPARQASLSIANSWSLLKPMSIESVMLSSHLILCCPLLLPPILPSIRVFSNESTIRYHLLIFWFLQNYFRWLSLNFFFYKMIMKPSIMQCACARLLQSCPTLCDLMDYSPPGSSVRGILQERILERVAMPSSRGSFWPRNRTRVSHVSCIGWWVLYVSAT